MKLLLDTHIWLWSEDDTLRLWAPVARKLADTRNELWLSPVSSWEIIVLCKKGRLSLEPSARAWISRSLKAGEYREAPVTQAVAIEAAGLTLAHGDAADRFLVATARVYDLTLVTADEPLMNLPGVSSLPNFGV